MMKFITELFYRFSGVRDAMLETGVCPVCQATGARPDSLTANKFVRTAVRRFDNDIGTTDNSLPKHLACPVCTQLIQDAVVLDCCGVSGCKQCKYGFRKFTRIFMLQMYM